MATAEETEPESNVDVILSAARCVLGNPTWGLMEMFQCGMRI
jgi:hypothetical protein